MKIILVVLLTESSNCGPVRRVCCFCRVQCVDMVFCDSFLLLQKIFSMDLICLLNIRVHADFKSNFSVTLLVCSKHKDRTQMEYKPLFSCRVAQFIIQDLLPNTRGHTEIGQVLTFARGGVVKYCACQNTALEIVVNEQTSSHELSRPVASFATLFFFRRSSYMFFPSTSYLSIQFEETNNKH